MPKIDEIVTKIKDSPALRNTTLNPPEYNEDNFSTGVDKISIIVDTIIQAITPAKKPYQNPL